MYEYNNQATRMAYIDVQTQMDMDLMAQINFNNPKFIEPTILKISIKPSADCEVLINGHSTVKVRSDLGLTISYEDIKITSLVAKTAGVQFYAVISY